MPPTFAAQLRARLATQLLDAGVAVALGVLVLAVAAPAEAEALRDRAVRALRRMSGADLYAWRLSPRAAFARHQRDRMVAEELEVNA